MDRNLKIGIVGLGLIGGSIFKALCALKCNVFGVSKSSSTVEKAKKYTKNVSKSLVSLKGCDIVFVCTPINKTIDILDRLDKIVSPNTIVTDVCSLKGFLANKKYSYNFIPSHPMAGTEFIGFDSAFESLFQGAKWILTPIKKTDTEELKNLIDIIHVLGASIIFTTPKEHDEAVALISHLLMVVSQGIFKTAKENDLALKMAASGFRDMTRLSLSNEEMVQDIINLNSNNIQNALLKLYSSIGTLLNKDTYKNQISEIKREREMMYIEGKNIL